MPVRDGQGQEVGLDGGAFEMKPDQTLFTAIEEPAA